ncbi:hypothetical protein J3A83DRAFT_4516659, partial [Scleroderma citrinum]
VCFSPSITHALQGAQSLLVDILNVKGYDTQSLVQLKNGWIVGSKGELLLWMPPSYQPFSWYSPWIRLVIPRGLPEFDLSRMAHGSN